jgi:hypothetical protein
MSYNVMLGYDIYDCFTMEHFRLRQRMTLTTKIYCSRLYNFHKVITVTPHQIKIGVWVAMSKRRIINPIFHNETVNAQRY